MNELNNAGNAIVNDLIEAVKRLAYAQEEANRLKEREIHCQERLLELYEEGIRAMEGGFGGYGF